MKIKYVIASAVITAGIISAWDMAYAGNWNSASSNKTYEIPAKKAEMKSINHNKSYGFKVEDKIVRLGSKSQRFEIRHGDCGGDSGYNDCKNDRRRVETIYDIHSSKAIDKVLWFGYSLYLPEDFQSVTPSNTTIGQLKLVGYRQPIWDLNVKRRGLTFKANASRQSCKLMSTRLDEIRGKWIDIMIGFDLGKSKKSGEGAFDGQFAVVYINGEKEECDIPDPVLTRDMIDNRAKKSKSFHFDWGIYNSYVSRWLDENKTKNPTVKGFVDKHKDSGIAPKSATNDPWSVDWGVDFPTQVVYYDEVRVGYSKDAVDINVNKKAVD